MIERQNSGSPSADRRRINFLGCPMDLMTSREFLDEARTAIERRESARTIQFVNGNKVAKIAEDPAFASIMWRADYVLTDGQPMIPLARLLGVRVPERIDGIGLMSKILALCDEHGFRVFLLGAKQDVVEACAKRIHDDFPRVVICGIRNGYFDRADLPRIAAEVSSTRPDVLFLGMGSPAKEEIADEFRDAFGAPIIQGVGGSFDVLAGLVRRSPIWIQRIGFEWLYRVLQEPRRMFWRYATTNTVCLRVFAATFLKRCLGRPILELPATAVQSPVASQTRREHIVSEHEHSRDAHQRKR